MSYQIPKFRHPELPRNELGYTKADYEGAIAGHVPRRHRTKTKVFVRRIDEQAPTFHGYGHDHVIELVVVGQARNYLLIQVDERE